MMLSDRYVIFMANARISRGFAFSVAVLFASHLRTDLFKEHRDAKSIDRGCGSVYSRDNRSDLSKYTVAFVRCWMRRKFDIGCPDPAPAISHGAGLGDSPRPQGAIDLDRLRHDPLMKLAVAAAWTPVHRSAPFQR
jgi:hypothetical protein